MCAEWEVSCDVMGHWSVTSQESAPGNSLSTLQDVPKNCPSFILHHLWFLLIDFNEISPLQSEWKALRETQTLRAVCSKVGQKFPSHLIPPSRGCRMVKIQSAGDGHYLYLQTQFGWGSMHTISSYRGNRSTNKQTHRQDRLQYTALLASAQCNDELTHLE